MTSLEREIRMDRERVVTATPPGPLHACPADAVGTAASRQPGRPFVAGRSSRPTRPGRLIGGFAAAVLLALTALFAAPMPASAQSDIWSATMTVGSVDRGHSTDESVGYRVVRGSLSAHGSITDNTFSIDGNDYTVSAVAYGTSTPSGLKLILNRALPDGLVLHLGDSAFSVGDATVTTEGGLTVFVWTTHGLDWPDDATVAVRLAPALPTVSIAEGNSPVEFGGVARFTVSRTGSTEGKLPFRIRLKEETGRTGTYHLLPGQSTVTGSHFAWDRDNGGNPICSITFVLVPRDAYSVSSTDGEATVTVTPSAGDTCSTVSTPITPTPVYSGLAVTPTEAVEGLDPTMDFVVTLQPAATSQVTVDYATEDGEDTSDSYTRGKRVARAGVDYTATSGTLTFEVGESRKTVAVPIIDDEVEDSGERVRLRLSNASGATITLNGQYGTIYNSEEERHAANTGEETQVALTASFEGVPESHDGVSAFTFGLTFSEEFELSWKTLKGYEQTPSAFQIANGSMTGISRVTQGENREWTVTVTPSGSGDVSITLPATTDCTASNAICTADGRALSAAVAATVPETAPVQVQVTPLTVAFEVSPPGEHDGAGEFKFHIAFSEDLDGYSWKTLQNTSLRIRQGTGELVPKVRRLVQGSNRRWEVKVTPSSKEDVTVGIGPSPVCTDAAAMCTSGGAAVSNAIGTLIKGPPGLSVADARVREAAGATVDFAVTLSRAAAATVTVDYATSDGTATAGSDYTAATGTLTFAPGALTKTVSVAVLDDSHDEGEETLTLSLSNVSGNNAWLKDATATGTIENTDLMPKAWLARFGRTVAGHVLDAVSERMKAPRAAGLSAALGGQALPGMNLSGDPAARPAEADTAEMEARARALSDWLNGGTGNNGDAARGIGSRTVTGRELVLGSTFSLTGETSDGGTAGFWGRAAVSGFDGREGDLSLDGEVTTGLLGADYGPGRWLMGLIASHSRGEGSYRGSSAGAVSSTLTGLHPWARYAVSERLSVWGAAGYGAGTLTLEPEGGMPMKADLSLALAAAGGRGELLEAPGAAGGRALALVGDAMFVRTESERTTGLAAASADVTRLRLALDGSWRFVLEGGPSLTPSLELGVRHDGGDAETGFGVDIGGGLAFADPKRGLIFDVSARTLVAHEAPGFRELGITAALSFDPLPSTDRGLTMSLRHTLGAASTDGAGALMRRETLAGLGADDDSDARRLELTAGYGIAMFDGRFTGTPELGVGLSDAGRDYRLGWRLGPGSGGGRSFELGLEAARRERANDDEAEHTAGFRIRAAW